MTDLDIKEERLEKLKEEKFQAEHRLTRTINRLSHKIGKQDKARTHRLIVEGAELEYVFEGIENIPQNDFRWFMNELCSLPEVITLFNKYVTTTAPTNEAATAKGGDD